MEFTLQNSPDREVPSERIGELAMEKLKDIDELHMFVLHLFIVNSKIYKPLWMN